MGTLENTCNHFLKYDLSNTFKMCSFTTATSILVKKDILNIVITLYPNVRILRIPSL